MIQTIISAILLIILGGLYLQQRRKVETVQKQLQDAEQDFEKQRSAIRIDAKKRSGAVQWGLAIENFAPFLDTFPLRPEDVTFLGKPIDYVGYKKTDSPTECSVHFIEVKSGKSQLLKHQRNIKKAIQEGRVHWHEIRVKSNKKVDS